MDISIASSSSAANYTRVGWTSEPNGRGTMSIILTCISTLFVCSWSVMHLNLPLKDSNAAERLFWRFYWCLICIFGPELAIWTAWRQWLAARALYEDLSNDKIIGTSFTMVHGFYAVMGGYVFDTNESFDASQPPFIQGYHRLYLTTKGVKLLAKCGHLPHIPKEDIWDKSKSDGLGKAVACIQASWMIAQIISRLFLRLPITLLEITTLGHVLCAMALYALWWHKPQNVEAPTVLKGDWTRPIAAFMLASSNAVRGGSSALPNFRVTAQRPQICEMRFQLQETEVQVTVKEISSDVEESCNTQSGLVQSGHLDAPHRSPDAVFTEQSSMELLRHESASRALIVNALNQYSALRLLLRRPATDSDRKQEAALAEYPEMPQNCRRRVDYEKGVATASAWLECSTQHLVMFKVTNWPHAGLLRTTGGLVMGTTLWVASIVFSAVHVAAWNASFPTTIEAWSWRASSLYIAFSGLFWAALHVIAQYSAWLWWAWYDFMSGDAPKALNVPVSAICTICGMMYAVGRMFLIVEGFVELRSLPMAAYSVPQWTLNAPHVG